MTVPYQRAYRYSKTRKYGIDNWLLSRKYDGIRCYYDRSQDLMLFRSGRIIVRMPHIQDYSKKACDNYNLSAIDGELYVPGLKYREIASLVNGQTKITDEQKQSIKLSVFALRKDGTELTTQEMIQEMKSLPTSQHIIIVDNEVIANNSDAIFARAKELQRQGWEGVVLRHPTISYEEGGSHKLLKVVVYHEDVYKIVGFTEGTRSYSGSLGGLLIEGTGLNDEFVPIPIRSRVSSGLRRAERQKIWDNKQDYFGVAVNVHYQKAQDARLDEDGFGSLRFPKYKGIVQVCTLTKFDDI